MINILPLNDLKEHIESSICDCVPKVEFENGEMIVIHNSYDGRELTENLTIEQKIVLEFTSKNINQTIKENTQIFLYGYENNELSIEDLHEMLKQAEGEEEFELALSLRDSINIIVSGEKYN